MPRPALKSAQFNSSEVQLLYQVARTLLSEHDYGELLASVLDVTIEGLGADRGLVVVPEGDGFRAAVARNFRHDALTRAEEAVSSSIAAEVLEQGRAVLIGDASSSDRFRNRESVQRLALRSVLCAPLVASNEAFALIYLENRDVSNCFNEQQRLLLNEICSLSAPRLRSAVAMENARKKAAELGASIEETDGILSTDPQMVSLLEMLHRVAPTDLPVLIQGETGTGKELIARALYRHSRRSSSPFLVLNCGAIPETLIGSELFGCVKGAYTGAAQDRVGLIGTAHRGTLFLDEVGELPTDLQPSLLRVLESGEYTRLGSVKPEVADIRIIAATNRKLEEDVEENRFRSDLYFRLAAITLSIPPLRDRAHEDIQLLTDQFLRAHARSLGREAPRLSQEALAALKAYRFPGNVRELRNELARLVAISAPGAVISVDSLRPNIKNAARPAVSCEQSSPDLEPMSLAEMEKRLIASVLEHTRGNRTQTAAILGISREGLRTKMQRLRLADTPTEAA